LIRPPSCGASAFCIVPEPRPRCSASENAHTKQLVNLRRLGSPADNEGPEKVVPSPQNTGRSAGNGKAVQKNQSVADVAVDVLARQARIHAEQSVEPFEEASRAVLELEAGRQFGEA
jgi:hypothetical protein